MKIPRARIEDFLLIFLLLFAPLSLGAVHTWSYCVIAVIVLILFDVRFLNDIEAFKSIARAPVFIWMCMFALVTFFYTVPVPAGILKLISPVSHKLRETCMPDFSSWQPLSLYPHATLIYLIKFISYAMIFFVIVSRISAKPGKYIQRGSNVRIERNFIFLGALTAILSILFHSICDFNLHIPANALYFTVIAAIAAGISFTKKEKKEINYPFLEKLVTSIIIISFTIAIFAIIQKLSWNGKIYWLIKKAGGNYGPYINYDHFAGFMEMCVFLAIAKFMSRISSSSFVRLKRIKEKIVWFSSKEASETLIYLFFAVVMTASLFFSTSRGGILSFCAALSVFYFSCVITAEKKKRNRLLLASAMAVILMVIMIVWIGPEETVDRFKGLNKMIRFFIKEKSILSELRPHMWKDTMALIKDFPLTGTGLGAYSCVFPAYRTFSASWGFLRYAHNDYLQFIAEIGICGLVFVAAFFVWYFRRFKECLRSLGKFSG
ncbi:MAG: O-antigen ligase family protein [Candidatus Omnitrophota bacterium]